MNPHRLRPFGWLLLVLLLLPPGEAVPAEDAYDTESLLPSRYGYLAVDTIVGRTVTQWELSKDVVIDRLPLGESTILIRLRAGRYHWSSIDIPYFDLPHHVDLDDDDRWAFRIEPQKINYAGTLIVDPVRASDAVGVRFVNRSSQITGKLREAYPALLATLGVRWAGVERDDFLDLMQRDDGHASGE